MMDEFVSGKPASDNRPRGFRSDEPIEVPRVHVRTAGLTLREAVLQIVALGIGLLLALGLGSTYVWGHPVPIWTFIALVLAYVLVTESVFLGSVYVRSIDIDERGVTFRFPFHTEAITWGDLSLHSRAKEMGLFWLVRPSKSSFSMTGERSYGVTADQFRAISEYPACPARIRGP